MTRTSCVENAAMLSSSSVRPRMCRPAGEVTEPYTSGTEMTLGPTGSGAGGSEMFPRMACADRDTFAAFLVARARRRRSSHSETCPPTADARLQAGTVAGRSGSCTDRSSHLGQGRGSVIPGGFVDPAAIRGAGGARLDLRGCDGRARIHRPSKQLPAIASTSSSTTLSQQSSTHAAAPPRPSRPERPGRALVQRAGGQLGTTGHRGVSVLSQLSSAFLACPFPASYECQMLALLDPQGEQPLPSVDLEVIYPARFLLFRQDD